ncbi:MAG: hypothetical protein ABIH22_04160 [Candidatus Margulisiibacteriota bacterium]
MKAQIRKNSWAPTKEFLPLILGKELGEELEEKEIKKLELFERGLANELKKEDTIEQAVTKIVKMALAAEFGTSLVAAKAAKAMIETITRGIMSDAELRKQALIIVDRFAHA